MTDDVSFSSPTHLEQESLDHRYLFNKNICCQFLSDPFSEFSYMLLSHVQFQYPIALLSCCFFL